MCDSKVLARMYFLPHNAALPAATPGFPCSTPAPRLCITEGIHALEWGINYITSNGAELIRT